MIIHEFPDANRFGTKMLEKMGWSKGKGLGIKEDGEQNFIRVSHKMDLKGMGFQDKDDQWTGHESQFNSLLESLHNSSGDASENEEMSNEQPERTGFGFESGDKKSKKTKSIKAKLSGNSLEEMSKKSGVRVHYRKFTRGKDLSKYSEKDLANIFGKKCINGEIVEKLPEEPEAEPESVEESSENIYGFTCIETGTTVQDYFQEKKRKRENGVQLEKDEPDAEISEKKRRKKERGLKPNSEHIETIDIEDSPPPKKDKKKKKSKKDQPSVEDTIVISDANEDQDVVATKMKKKKKKCKKNADDEKPQEIDDNSVNCIEVKKKKRDKKRSIETATENPEVNTIESESMCHTQFIDGILGTLVDNNRSVHSSTTLNSSNVGHDEAQTSTSLHKTSSIITMDEVFEINRYHAEMFRFVDLDGFPNSNLSELSGYGYGKDFELKISEKSKDQGKINDLWDYALINKYGKEVIQAKKAQRYSKKTLKKKNLFMKL